MIHIATLKLSPVTPVSMGWYDTYSDHIVRVTSIRGVIRWWTRALIGGYLFDKGLDHVETTNNIIEKIFGGSNLPSRIKISSEIINLYEKDKNKDKTIEHFRITNLILIEIYSLKNILDKLKKQPPKPNEERKLRSRLQKILNKIKETEKPFTYRIKMKLNKNNLVKDLNSFIKQKNLIRNIKQISDSIDNIIKKCVEGLLKSYDITIKLSTYSKKIDLEEKLALLSTIITFDLGGLGKASRRGLGSFNIKGVQINETLKDQIDSSLELNELINQPFEERIRNIIIKGRELIEALVDKLKLNKKSNNNDIPAFPSITINRKYFSIWTKKVNDYTKEIEKLLIASKGGLAKHLKNLTEPSAWYLGLPRSQRGTGYVDGELRRPSPLWIKVIKENNQYRIILSHFASRDWPTFFRWVGKYDRQKRISVNANTIKDLFIKVNKYLQSEKYREIDLKPMKWR